LFPPYIKAHRNNNSGIYYSERKRSVKTIFEEEEVVGCQSLVHTYWLEEKEEEKLPAVACFVPLAMACRTFRDF